MNVPLSFFGPGGDTQQRLALVVDTMRELSRQTDPQAIVRLYNRRMQELIPTDRRISLSRRELTPPRVRVTRFNLWTEEINPWKERDRLPVLPGGLLGDLIWAGEPPSSTSCPSLRAIRPRSTSPDGH
jgi:sigma-B regulation protein RsbU (phosphoserine phosphatase)